MTGIEQPAGNGQESHGVDGSLDRDDLRRHLARLSELRETMRQRQSGMPPIARTLLGSTALQPEQQLAALAPVVRDLLNYVHVLAGQIRERDNPDPAAVDLLQKLGGQCAMRGAMWENVADRLAPPLDAPEP